MNFGVRVLNVGIVGGSQTFYNFTSETAGKVINFRAGGRQQFVPQSRRSAKRKERHV